MVMQSLTDANKGFPCVKHALLKLLLPVELSHAFAQHHSYFRMLGTAGNISPAPWAEHSSLQVEER